MMVEKYEQKIIENVEKYGWHGTSVAPRADSDDPQEQWTYTTGLTKSHGWPEIVMFGQDSERAHGIIWAAVDECEARNLIPCDGLRLHDTLNGYEARLVDGSFIPKHYLNSAFWFARHNRLNEPKVLQLLWPDHDGIFPNESGCNGHVVADQTPMEKS
jgi:Domain of unknown function (DUF4262)